MDLRGSIDASAHGIRPGAESRKSKAFARLLKEAAEKNTPVFLPPGDYAISNITLPVSLVERGSTQPQSDRSL